MNNHSGQTQRLWQFLQQHPHEDLSQPELNSVCAGPGGVYVASWSKRASEVRRLARSQGGDFVKVRDEWVKTADGGKRRETSYRYIPQLDHACNCATNAPEFAAIYGCTCGVRP